MSSLPSSYPCSKWFGSSYRDFRWIRASYTGVIVLPTQTMHHQRNFLKITNHLKNKKHQIGPSPQVEMKITNPWRYHFANHYDWWDVSDARLNPCFHKVDLINYRSHHETPKKTPPLFLIAKLRSRKKTLQNLGDIINDLHLGATIRMIFLP